ncbi:MAG: SDR family NAD(P)-dependent oxidoreductase [Thermodesulfovibrionales bacterium]|nr:SDR family NAD(P)-dependent oxidoreductase [Thermodesulfovibrionales bacterium]
MTKKAIVIGATSGIGKELAKIFSQNDYIVGLAGRRTLLLDELKNELPNNSFAKYIDVSQTAEAINQLKELIAEMEGVDIIVISSGVGYVNKDIQWSPEKETIDVNVSGFTAMANVAIGHFLSKGSGHLVGISSISALRGDGDAPAYNASKAFVSNYLEGLRKKVAKLGLSITVTDIQPGFVDTAMAKGDGLFWVASPQKAAQQIYNAIERKKKHAYITKRWRLIGWLMKVMPEFIYNRI